MRIVLYPATDAAAVDPALCKKDSKALVLRFLIVWLNRFEVVGAMQQVIDTGTTYVITN